MNYPISVRVAVTLDQYMYAQTLARRSNVTVSEWIRALIVDAVYDEEQREEKGLELK
jgi:hypothetical protein